MKTKLFFVMFGVSLVLKQSAFGADIIIESRSEGQNFSKYKELSGNWISSQNPPDKAKSSAPGLTPQGKIGTRKATANSAITKKPVGALVASARFSPELTEAGKYYVYFTYPSSANATPVTYVIKHADGETKKLIAQDGWGSLGEPKANKWLTLGEYNFAPGADQYVEIQVFGESGAVSPSTQGQAFTDAVRFSDAPISNATTPHDGIPARPIDAPTVAAASSAAERVLAPIPWNSLTDGRAKAQSENKKLFIFFHSSSATRSSDYESKVLNNAKIKSLLSKNFIPVKVNMDTENSTAAQLEVFRAGTISIFNASGIALEKITDTPDAVKLEEILKKLS